MACITAFMTTVFLQGCGGGTDASSGSGSSGGPSPAQIVGVSGNRMTLNGSPWLPRGVTLQALVRSAAQLQAGDGTAAQLTAQESYGATELAAIQAFGADTIRFQVSQPALDATNSSGWYDPNYLSEVVGAVKLARQNGFVVMIMMQDETITGETDHAPLPTAVTQADWDLLNAQFATDPGVVYELYNEPNLPETTANWALWLNGGTQTTPHNQSVPAIGMQTLITRLRGAGSQNVFVLDGLDLAKTLAGIPTVSDPLNLLVYAVHPYPDGSADESGWDSDFGDVSQRLPVWADEWSAATDQKLGLKGLCSYQVAVDFLNYIRTHNIALGAGAFDVPDFMVQDVPGWAYTNYDNFPSTNCPISTTAGDNAGELVHVLYTTNYSQVIMVADGL
jgi:endoglucanase